MENIYSFVNWTLLILFAVFTYYMFKNKDVNMLLFSKFKDYYDYMIGITGVDEKVVFNRDIIKTTEVKHTLQFPRCNHRKTHYYYVLSICGKRYTLTCDKGFTKWSDLRLLTKDDLKDEEIFSDNYDKWYYFNFKKRPPQKEIDRLYLCLQDVYDEDLVGISKMINMPIFMISRSGTNSVNIYERSPILSEIKGISSLLKPDRLYNDICFFIANVLNNNNPNITQISNKDKILKGGFDLKTSFRNM